EQMTLNMSIVSKHFIAQSSDLRLTDPKTGKIVEDASPKQVGAVYFDWRAVIGYSGPARLDGQPTHTWIADLISGIPKDDEPRLTDLVELIRAKGSQALLK